MAHWRNQCRPIIQKVIADNKHLSEQELRKALFEAYPFGERKYHPYKIWLSEIRFQLGKQKTYGGTKKPVVDKNQTVMF